MNESKLPAPITLSGELWAETSVRAAGDVVAWSDGVEVGRLIWEAFHRRRHVLVNNITVVPAYQRHRIASRMLAQVMERFPGYTVGASTRYTEEGRAFFAAQPYPSADKPR